MRALQQLLRDVETARGHVLAHAHLDQLVGLELRVGLPDDGIADAVVADVQRRREALPQAAEVAPLLTGELAHDTVPSRNIVANGSRRRRHSSGIPPSPGPSATMLPTMAHKVSQSPKRETAVHSAPA
jgi:hypothetical protein